MSDDVTADLLIVISRIFFLLVPSCEHKLKRSKELLKTWVDLGVRTCKMFSSLARAGLGYC